MKSSDHNATESSLIINLKIINNYVKRQQKNEKSGSDGSTAAGVRGAACRPEYERERSADVATAGEITSRPTRPIDFILQ